MGREKRKGKEIVVEEPARKRTRAAREAERAGMVAKAAEEQASGRARPFAIRDPSARGRGRGRGMGRVRGTRATRATTAAAAAESDRSLSAAESDSDTEAEQSDQSQRQGTQESPTLRRSGRTRQTSPAGDTSPATERRTGPRTRGGHQPQEPRRSAAAAAARRAEALAAERAVFRMDTVVRLEPGVLLQNLTKANAAKVKRLRWSVQEEDWFPVTRDSRVDRRFWTLLQASFYETYQRRGHRIFPHRVLDWVSLRTAAGGADVREHFAHFRGLPRLLSIERNRYIEDWVRAFYATAWIAPERRAIHFMFGGQVFGLSRATLAGILGVDLVDVSLHEMVYGDADPPRRAMIGGIAPSHEAISQCFRQPFPASYARVPSLLTPEAYAVHMALRRTLLPRSGYPEGFTGLQQLLLLHILTHEPFDIVDFILAEIEDVITDGMGVVRQFPYAHWISYICSMIVPAESPVSAVYRQDEVPWFPVYRPTAPQDRRRGRQADRAAMAQLSPEAQARVAQEDEALLAAEAQLPGGEDEIHWSEIESDSSEDEEYFPAPAPASHDHEAGGSREPAPESAAAATVSESQVSQPSELTALLQQLVTQQREDRLAQEEARRAHEAQLAAIQREAARERAATEERFVGLIDRVSQRTDAQFQQMQQGMMAMFGMISQLYSHTGLAPQQPGQPGLQGVGAPPLAVTPAPAPTAPATSATPETMFSMSALLGSAGRPFFSPLPATSLFQESPSAVQTVGLPVVPQTLPSGGGGEGSLLQQSTQPAASALTTSDVDTSSAEPVTTSTDPLPGSANTRASTTATPPVSSAPAGSSDQQLPSVTEDPPSDDDDDDDPDRFLAVPRQPDQ